MNDYVDELDALRKLLREKAAEAERLRAPIPMLLRCPRCTAEHVDDGEFRTRPHRTHLCEVCGEKWRPALVCTVGVVKLPEEVPGGG